MRQVLPFARHETVDDANAFAAADELFCQVRADEAGAAGYQVQSHNGVDLSKTTAATARYGPVRARKEERKSQSPCKPTSVRRCRLAAAPALTTIPLVPRLLAGSSDLPGGFGRAVLKRHPIWSCSVRGFACRPCCHERGALLPHLFTLTLRLGAACRQSKGGMFSVPLSVRFPCPGVTRRTALRRSDFPPAPAVGVDATGYTPICRRPCGDRRSSGWLRRSIIRYRLRLKPDTTTDPSYPATATRLRPA